MDSSLAVMDVKVRPMHAELFTPFLEPPNRRGRKFELWLRITGSVHVEGKKMLFTCNVIYRLVINGNFIL